MKPLARHFCEVGFGSPDVVTVVYVVKIVLYALVGWLFFLSTPGVDGFTAFTTWWDSPALFYKFVVWTMLFEVLGLGCGFGPLNLRFTPPLGSFLYWLRPGTIRLAPWPGRVPLTGGDSRTVVDVVLYAALLVSLVVAAYGALPRWQVAVVLGILAVLGLRDKVIFLAARSEVYGTLAVTYLFVDRRPAHRGDARHGRDLVGSRDLQAQPALPVRGRRDGEQQPDLEVEEDQAAVPPRLPRGPAPLTPLRDAGARRHRRGVRRAAAAPARRRRSGDEGRRRRDAPVPPAHPDELPDGRAAGVERLHDARDRDPVRGSRRARRHRPGQPAAGGPADAGRGRHGRARQPVPRQGLVPPGDALLRRQLGHLDVVLPRGRRWPRWTRTPRRRR